MNHHLWTLLKEKQGLSFKFLSCAFVFELHLKLSAQLQERNLFNKLVQVNELDDELDKVCLMNQDLKEDWVIMDNQSNGIALYHLEVWIRKIEEGNLRKAGNFSIKLKIS